MSGRLVVFDTDWFVATAIAKYGTQFDYSRFIYVNAKTKSIVICKDHGELLISPATHIRSVYGCQKCGLVGRTIARRKSAATHRHKLPTSVSTFISMVIEKHGDKFDIDTADYVGLTLGTVTLICKDHGSFTFSPPRHLLKNSNGCPRCGTDIIRDAKIKDYDNFFLAANSVHGNRYTYPESNRSVYVTRKSIIEVICDKHGSFLKKAQNHLAGQGCFRCRVDELVSSGVLCGGYGNFLFENNRAKATEPAIVYYMVVGSCFKIGITVDIRSRIKSIRSLSKREPVLLDSFESTLEHCFAIEQRILSIFSSDRIMRNWSTEVFGRDVLCDTNLRSFA